MAVTKYAKSGTENSSNWIKPVALKYFDYFFAIAVIYALLISLYCFDTILRTYSIHTEA